MRTNTELLAEIEKLQEKYNFLKTQYDNLISGNGKVSDVLQASEGRFRKIIEQAPIAMAIVSLDGIIEYINLKAVEVFGYRHEEIPDMNSWWNLAYPDEIYRKEVVADWMGRVQTALKEGTEIPGNEYQVSCKDNTIRTFYIFGVPVSGKIAVIFDDITERKHAVDALTESEERFRILFDDNPLPTLLSEIPSGKIAFVNKRMSAIMGLSPKDIIGKSANDLGLLNNPEDQAKLTGLITEKGYVDNVEISKVLPNGMIGADLIFMRLVTLNQKLYCLTITQDISEQKQVEDSLKKSEERYRLLIETTETGFVVIDDKGIVLDANSEYVGLSGHNDIKEILGRCVVEWTAPEEKDVNTLNIEQCLKNGFIRNFEISYINREGKRTPIEINASVIREKGKVKILTLCRDITKRRLMEIALHESEQHYKMISELTSDYIFRLNIDVSGNVTLDFVSDNFYSITGRRREEVLTIDSWFNVIYPDDIPKVVELVQKLIKEPHSTELECRYFTHNNILTWISIVGKSEWSESENRVIAIVGAAKDITDRKKAEDQIRESEEKFRIAFDNAPTGMSIIGPKGNFYEINPLLSEMVGHTKEEVLSGSVSLITHPDDIERSNEWIRKKINNEPCEPEFEKRFMHKDGHIVWGLVRSQWIRDKDGKPLRAITHILDITKRKNAEELLKLSEERYKLLHEYAPVGILLVNCLGEILEVNSSTIKILGSPSIEATKAINLLNFPLLVEAGISGALQNCIDTGEVVFGEFPYKTKWGKIIYMQIRFVPICNENAKVELIHTIIEDISERKNIEKELIKAKEKAEESDRLKTAFLQNMSHEIRTPMNAIMGFSDLLVENYGDKDRLKKFSGIINQRCSDLLEIINDILDIAKIESGQLTVSFDECDIKVLFAELNLFFKEHQKRINKEHIKFSLHLNGNDSSFIIKTDKVKLKQILINLIGNAFKFTENGSIECGCKIENNSLVFYISDTGYGISKDKHDIIFERFSQINNPTSKIISGTGLGLSIAKGLTTLLGGKIWLESEPGKGSVFYFSINYIKSDLSLPELKQNAKNLSFYFSNKTILIVEDDIYNAEYLKEILADKGLTIISTEYGKSAIQIVQDQQIDLILMDIRLPDMNGYEATRIIKKSHPQIMVIAQTAYAAQDEKQKAIDAGCIDYISKPTKQVALISLLSKYLKVNIP